MNIGWVFDPAPPSGSLSGGVAAQFSFDCGIDSLVRESIQNSMDARKDGVTKARIVFRLVQLEGKYLDEFKDAINWRSEEWGLADNLESVKPTSPSGLLIKRGLNELDEDGRLSLLVIEDYGTKGLNGKEFYDPKGSFGSLVKHTLISHKSDETAGGAFGLGSSVLWSMSSIQTVLFHSVLSEPVEGQERNRFMGAVKLPTHKTEQDGWCDGAGYLGVVTKSDQDCDCSESIWGRDAQRISKALQCKRADDETGLSAVIVGLAEPGFESRAHDEILESIKESALISFWPALVDGRLDVEIRTETNGKIDRSVIANDELSNDPWKHLSQMLQHWHAGEARSWPHDEGDDESNKWELKLTEVDVEVPERIGDLGHREVKRQVPILIQIIPEPVKGDEDPWEVIRNRIFKFRGPGMIVRSDQKSNISVSAKPFVAIVPCGKAAGGDEGNLQVEHYLRSAEPPAHDEWRAGTQLLNANYRKHGIRAKLKRFQSGIVARIREVVSVPPTNGGELPLEMRKLLSFGGGGDGQTDKYLDLSGNGLEATNEGWRLDCGVKRRTPNDKPWHVSVKLVYAGESGSAQMRGFSDIECVGQPRVQLVHQDDEKASASFLIPADVGKAKFKGNVAGESLPSIGMRGRAKLIVRGYDSDDQEGEQ